MTAKSLQQFVIFRYMPGLPNCSYQIDLKFYIVNWGEFIFVQQLEIEAGSEAVSRVEEKRDE